MFDQNPLADQEQSPAISFSFLESDVALAFSTDTTEKEWIGFRAQSETGTADLHLEASALANIVVASGYKEEMTKWTASTKSMVLMHLCRSLLVPLGTNLGMTFSIRMSVNPPHEDALQFVLRSPDLWAGELRVSGDADIRNQVIEAFEAALPEPEPEDLAQKRITARLMGPTFEIDATTFAEMVEGDVLLFDPNCNFFEMCLVRFSDGRGAPVNIADGECTLLSMLDVTEIEIPENTSVERSMIRFSIELEKYEISGEEAAELDEGSILPFKPYENAWVRIFEGDRQLGSGQLVTIDERTHVRLMKMG